MYSSQKKYFSNVLEKLARESAVKLLTMSPAERTAFLSDLSTKQLRRILPVSTEYGDAATCSTIHELITARGYHSEL